MLKSDRGSGMPLPLSMAKVQLRPGTRPLETRRDQTGKMILVYLCRLKVRGGLAVY